MAYEFRYELISAPIPTKDGSTYVSHDVQAVYRVDPDEEWLPVGGRHKSILVPATELLSALGRMSNAEIVVAYKQTLVDNLNTIPTKVVGWDAARMTLFLDNNAQAAEAGTAADEFITLTLDLSYPVRFLV